MPKNLACWLSHSFFASFQGSSVIQRENFGDDYHFWKLEDAPDVPDGGEPTSL